VHQKMLQLLADGAIDSYARISAILRDHYSS
jgi:hypothetical protein